MTTSCAKFEPCRQWNAKLTHHLPYSTDIFSVVECDKTIARTTKQRQLILVPKYFAHTLYGLVLYNHKHPEGHDSGHLIINFMETLCSSVWGSLWLTVCSVRRVELSSTLPPFTASQTYETFNGNTCLRWFVTQQGHSIQLGIAKSSIDNTHRHHRKMETLVCGNL